MARTNGPQRSSPAGPPPSQPRSGSGSQPSKSQRSILGFFSKNTSGLPSRSINNHSATATDGANTDSSPSLPRHKLTVKRGSSSTLTPAPSSDAIEAPSSPVLGIPATKSASKIHGLPSPVTPGDDDNDKIRKSMVDTSIYSDSTALVSSPPRKAKKVVNYAETDDEGDDDEDIFKPVRARSSKRRRRSLEDESEGDAFVEEAEDVMMEDDEDIDDFVVADDSSEDLKAPKKRKRPTKNATRSSSANNVALPQKLVDDDGDLETPAGSTAAQWTYDPENTAPLFPGSITNGHNQSAKTKKYKEKAHISEPEQRYPWLAKVTDADRNPPGHPDHDPRTVYIPPLAWSKFSAFEKQYWEIKQKLWDTIVFFKKGKFYELYEHDATIGHQLFDLKLTDRVNMRMVGVPEMSLDHWANQFVAKGFKIARVDQCESALGKEMRERNKKDPNAAKEDKIIRRELAQVLTAGTLVDGGMLQDDMSTFCVAIKESVIDDRPAFGVCFVDAATAAFAISEFVDDVDLTKFETLIAQIRPQEIILEKGCVSVRAMRILKNNTSPTTLWNHLKSGREFWSADVTRRAIDAGGYFVSDTRDNIDVWPEALREAAENELLMSALGALIQYLSTLKIERDLLTVGNFSWYDPIRKATSLVLDGQTLINLEIFANSFDGSTTGTLFALLNRCITPFGKRTFRQWVCHPLADPVRINARLDAVDSLNADTTIRDQFTSQLTRLPDLERLISRIHAGCCRARDFARVLEGFEQIEYTMSLLQEVGGGDGVIGQLIENMPDLRALLQQWKTAFDHAKARENDVLVPERGVEADFDASQDRIEASLAGLEKLLKKARRDLGSNAICYRDNGKEIYQLEVPIKVKGVPKDWQQMSATVKVKRYYSPELRQLVRRLQEEQETHGQIVKEVAGRFYRRFDEDYSTWLAAVKIIAQLDCLISLAKASSALGAQSCRPVFVDDARSVVEFEELRHPCMLPSVSDFIPNDIRLGGSSANINLLTGANAAGKSTILRMTCIAVIMSQVGCHIPAIHARLTPIDRIMSRLGANDHIFAAQSTFYVELAETQKILAEATPRSLIIIDELGRGTSSYDGVAVAQAVLHHVATHLGCVGFFATHYHSLAAEFAAHPEIRRKRMRIHVDDERRRVTFLYRLEDGVAEGSFGMHCAAMCGIDEQVIERAEVVARKWAGRGRAPARATVAASVSRGQLADGMLTTEPQTENKNLELPLGFLSDLAWALRDDSSEVDQRGLDVLLRSIQEV